MQLLPKDKDIGWTPYLWLVYLPLVALNVEDHASPLQWAFTFLGMGALLVLYFRAYWVRGKQLLWLVIAMGLLGVIYAPINPGACAYFIYASAFVGRIGTPGLGWTLIGILESTIVVETFLFHRPPQFWLPAVVFTAMIGAIGIFYAERHRDNAKLRMAREEVEHMAKIAERERIARDLHDVLGHTLSVIILKSELASKLAEKDPARALKEIKDVESISRDALAQVRSTVRGYHTLSLQAEADQAAANLRASGVNVECAFAQAVLPPSHEGVLALALREAVTNVIRHARASYCALRLRSIDGTYELEVRDDGCGGASQEGLGLTGMRHRVEALGGKLQREISSGTRLVITLPAK
ncbi:MAG TPA: sensor histidine kinase [Candidatus Angelobacter sp.]|nr:sensor histidine kinase [Candidatus Angelobacter sp.]